MKICPQSARFTALREGWLEEEEARQLHEHLAECDVCNRTFRELEMIAGLLAAESGPVKPPPGGYEELLRTTLLMRDRISPMPARTPSRWRRGAAIAAAVLLIGITAISVLDSRNGSTSSLADITGEDAALQDLIEEHALASSTIGFSDGASLMVMASRDRH
jgi:anti-sigma factor RsiW